MPNVQVCVRQYKNRDTIGFKETYVVRMCRNLAINEEEFESNFALKIINFLLLVSATLSFLINKVKFKTKRAQGNSCSYQFNNVTITCDNKK